ncbi:AzlC family ABC transporter permease [Pelomicrobium methylotrophicum]|uniref:AzlC family ABC transporter permease n=1 Tax=Pelomicrobium methylotrophicum TaxID=2602750 RepID=A0A5C7EYH3_9PROT|nr:AzlC family ABC transporter permease [Pelomicrobium methylotrophicum]TXF12283.1 AzlC family ABC transporter permease [Pelomicrobium methylotrophicum]
MHWSDSETRQAFLAGARDALGAPALVLFAGMIGFGALGRESGLGVWVTSATSFFIYALPGQVVFVEMFAVGASWLAIFLAVSLTAARFLPMTLTLMPQVPRSHHKRLLYLLVHLVSMTTWASMMSAFPRLKPEERLPYFTGFGMVCWGVSVPGTVLGYLAAGYVPPSVTLGLVFLNPLFFLLMFAEVRQRASRLALLIGGVSGPLMHLMAPGWSLLVCGVVGGSAAFLLDRMLRLHGR